MMVGDMLKKLIGSMGYQVRRVPKNFHQDGSYVLYDYRDDSGNVDYERYRSNQIEANLRKINRSYAQQENIQYAAELLKSRLGTISNGICHGTRRGLEQKWFREYLGADVFGTEISHTAKEFENTIQWDFHEVKPEWLGAFDFIYSNSFDHSFDPERCINSWMSCLRVGGVCVIEHSEHNGIWAADARDPFGAELHTMPYLICRWGRGRFAVREIVEVPKFAANVRFHSFLLIQRLPDWADKI
jgi:SAM-dependent methyltransferase